MHSNGHRRISTKEGRSKFGVRFRKAVTDLRLAAVKKGIRNTVSSVVVRFRVRHRGCPWRIRTSSRYRQLKQTATMSSPSVTIERDDMVAT